MPDAPLDLLRVVVTALLLHVGIDPLVAQAGAALDVAINLLLGEQPAPTVPSALRSAPPPPVAPTRPFSDCPDHCDGDWYKEAVPVGHPAFGVLQPCCRLLARRQAAQAAQLTQTLATMTNELGLLLVAKRGRGGHGAVGSLPPAARNGERLEELIQYLRDRQPYIPNYRQRGRARHYIGSGHAEKANDQIVAKRQKAAGMHWSHETGDRPAALRTLMLNGGWNRHWRHRQVLPLVAT
jgi:hypothetical protein